MKQTRFVMRTCDAAVALSADSNSCDVCELCEMPQIGQPHAMG